MVTNRGTLRAKIARQTRSARRLPRRLSHAAGVALQVLYWAATFQLRAGMRRRREARLIRNSDLFDRPYYLAQCPGEPAAEKDPVQHYLSVGAGRGLDPSPLFDSSTHAERNPVAAARGENPLAHFIRSRAHAPSVALPGPALRRGAPWPTRPSGAGSWTRSVLVVRPSLRGGGRDDSGLALVARLREEGYAVTLVRPDERAPAARADDFGRPGVTVHHGLDAALRHLASEGHAHDLVLLAGAHTAFRLLPAVRAHATYATVIYDRATFPPSEGEGAAGELDAAVVARMDEVTARCADVTWVPSEADREALLRHVPDARPEVTGVGGALAPLARSARERGPVQAHAEGAAPDRSGRRIPAAAPERLPERSSRRRGTVLVVGVYVCDVEHNAIAIARELERSEEWTVEQKWIALGKSAPPPALEAVTAWRQRSRVAKFVLLNRLLGKLDLRRYDYVFVTDDDISLPERFVDTYLDLVIRHDLALAQPARTHDSYTDNWIVERLDGLTARRTRFVEIGPLFSMRRDAVRLLTPFDETSPMGWALDFFWPVVIEGAGLRMGIVDATPVAHDMRKPVALYDNRDAAIAMQAFLSKRPHLSQHDAFSIVEAYP